MRHTFKPYRQYDFFTDGKFVDTCPKCGQHSLRVTSVILVAVRQKPFRIDAELTPDGFFFSDQLPSRLDHVKDHSTEDEKLRCNNPDCGWYGPLLMEGTEEHYKALKKQGRGFRDYLEDQGLDQDEICRRAKCPEPTAGGEGFDGYCGECADKGYGDHE